MIVIDVLGTPAPKGSSRPMVNSKTGIAFSFAGGSKVTEIKLKSWDASVRTEAFAVVGARAEPVYVDKPLAVAIEFRMARPAGHWGKGKHAGKLTPKAASVPRSKPDIDKLVRATLDSLTGLVFDDDSRIVELLAKKVYADPGQEGARIAVKELP